MATEFPMPKLGLTMESGTILEWLVADRAAVAEGDAVLLIETDKVESEVLSSGSGILHQFGVVGETYECGELIGWFLAEGEEPPGGTRPTPAPPAEPATPAPPPAASAPVVAQAARGDGGRILASPNARRVAAESGVDLAAVAGSGPGGRIVSEDVAAVAAAAPAARGLGGRILASPNAKRMAGELGVDLAAVAGSGPGGRIVSEDVQAVAAATTAAPAVQAAPSVASPDAAPVPVPSGGRALASFAARALADELGIDLDTVGSLTGDVRLSRDDVAAHARALIAVATRAPLPPPTAAPASPPTSAAAAPAESTAAPLLQEPSEVIAMRGMRGTIARRMHDSLRQMAQLTLNMDVDMTAVAADRAARKEAPDAGGDAPGFTDYVIAAVARALQQHPHVNSQITDQGVALLPQVNVGLAVALDDGLMVPVVSDTPSLDLAALSAETSRLAAAARDGKLQLADLEGGTFSVTALGMFGVDGFTPVINAPNTAILGVGRLRDETAWDGDTPRRTTVLTLSLTWDHRAFDGAPAAEFVRTIKTILESGELA